jgi:hypothetical protein
MKIDIEKIKKIISETTDEVSRGNLIILLRSYQQTRQAYTKEATADRLRNWEKAGAALEKLLGQYEDPQDEDDISLGNIANVLLYLKAEGWKATKTSLYRHQSEGKFLPQDDGRYLQKDIDKYAKSWLKEQATGKRVNKKKDDVWTQNKELENRKLLADTIRAEFALAKEQGKYIPKEQMEIELAGRAGILDAGLKHMIQSRAADWIRAVSGDMKKIGELINMMNADWDEHLNSYASVREYEIIIDAEEGEIVLGEN